MRNSITLLGAPMDLGQLRRGVDMGPSAIRYAGVIDRLTNLGFLVEDLGDIQIDRKNVTIDPATGLRNLGAVLKANEILAKKVDEIMHDGSFPLVLGGDHSISIGSIAGISKHYENLGVIWYDAHTDINTPETSPSGNIHGMPLAVSLGLGDNSLTNILGYTPKIKPENIIVIGARSIDEGERKLVREMGIKVYTMHDIDRRGMTQIIEESINYLRQNADGVHLSLDLDALDPLYAPGVGTPVAGGTSYRESHLAMELLAEADIITSADFVEVNPILDEKNKTGILAVDLMCSLFGEKLL